MMLKTEYIQVTVFLETSYYFLQKLLQLEEPSNRVTGTVEKRALHPIIAK